MARPEGDTYTLTACTTATVGYTLVTDGPARHTLPGLAMLSAAADYYELAAAASLPRVAGSSERGPG